VGYTQTRFWASVWASGAEAHLDDLFVVEKARSRGIGRSLLRHALLRAEARGALRFCLNTNERNEAAQSLYRSEGLAPQSHALYPGGREVLWVKALAPNGARGTPMSQTLGYVTILVRDYDEAIAFFTHALGFERIEDTPLQAGKRWVVVAPQGSRGTALLLARASTPEQEALVGRQTGGRVSFFLHTDDLRGDYERMKGRGVRFRGEPRSEAYGSVVVFEDLYGNPWDLVEPPQSFSSIRISR
jgi:catechol 2,3-dioxygenase-like lactoylglutathione lyase family enzyme